MTAAAETQRRAQNTEAAKAYLEKFGISGEVLDLLVALGDNPSVVVHENRFSIIYLPDLDNKKISAIDFSGQVHSPLAVMQIFCPDQEQIIQLHSPLHVFQVKPLSAGSNNDPFLRIVDTWNTQLYITPKRTLSYEHPGVRDLRSLSKAKG